MAGSNVNCLLAHGDGEDNCKAISIFTRLRPGAMFHIPFASKTPMRSETTLIYTILFSE